MSTLSAILLLPVVWIGAFISYFIIFFLIGFIGLGCGSECEEITISVLDKTLKYLPYIVILPAIYLSYILLNIIAKNSQNTTNTSNSINNSVPKWRRMSVAQLTAIILIIPVLILVGWATMEWFFPG